MISEVSVEGEPSRPSPKAQILDRSSGRDSCSRVSGTDFTEQPVTLEAGGEPPVVLFLAQVPPLPAGGPAMQSGSMGAVCRKGPRFYPLPLRRTRRFPNFPPAAWLEDEGWTPPVLVDDEAGTALKLGLSAFPFWVFLDSEGNVAARAVGRSSRRRSVRSSPASLNRGSIGCRLPNSPARR